MASAYTTENPVDHQDTVPREKPQPILRKRPVDQWSIRERLALASAVCQSGDQNWVSVSRAIRPFAEPGRRSDWFSQKNCALQYADLLEKVETPKRKRSERGEIIETPGMQIVRKLTLDRLEEIKSASVDFHRQYRKLKTEIEMVNSGHCDEKLAEIWEQIQLRCKEKEEKAAAAQRALDEDRRARAAQKGRQQLGGNTNAEFEDSSTQDSVLSDSVDVEEPQVPSGTMAATSQSLNTGGQHQPSGMVLAGSSASVDSKSRDTPPPPPSHLLTTLLQKKTPLDMSCLRKDDVNKHDGTESLLCPTPKKMDHQPVLPGVTPSAGAPTLTMLLNTSSSGASMGIRQVPAAVVAVTAASTAAVSSVASAIPTGVLPVATSAADITTAGTPALYSVAVPAMLTSPASTVPAVSQTSVLMEPVSLESASPPAVLPPTTDVFSDADATNTVSDTSEVPRELPLGLPVSVDASMSAEANQALDVCIDVNEAPAATDEVIVEHEIVTTEQLVETDSSMEHCQVAGDMQPATDSTGAQPQTVQLLESAAALPAQDQELVAAEYTAAEHVPLPQIRDEQLEELVQSTIEAVEYHVPMEQLPTDAAATAAVATASVAPLSPPAAAPATAVLPSVPPPAPPIAVQTPVEEVPVITTGIVDASQVPVMSSPIATEVLELKPIVDKPPSPDIAQQPDAAQPAKHACRTSTAKRSGDAGRSRRSSRGPKKVSDAAGSDETSVTEQLTVASAAAAGPVSDEVLVSILPTPASEDIHREKQQPEACPPPDDIKTTGDFPMSVEMISDDMKDITSNAVAGTDGESTVSAHIDLIPPSVSDASIASSAPPLAAASPGASPAADVPSVPTAVAGELTSTKHLPVAAGSSAESLPCSPASVPLSDDSEEEKSYKIWRKAITLVWRSVANHKYANVFLHPVTDDIAPGYTSIVYRPMDLHTIKKNIENGTIKTTAEFQRDMMLMFTNAIMYNDTNHDVYKMAMEMYDDAMQHIEQFVHTQLMLKEQETKVVSLRGRRDAAEKDDDKRRPSYDHGEGGKRKRTRADDDK